ncbi:MAG: alcohol dehydrogenase catalytic domain-containing protein [Gammaproteobacteria bacterium]|nr:alcohol dehydrogenase catalytic domain-containing protein [Gammaproteobacteria bacterium]
MQAALLTEFQQPIQITDVAEPVLPKDGVVIKVLACGVCRSDHHAWQGVDPDVTLPHIPGHEFSGEVVEVGADVRRFKVGDRVIAPFILACGHCVHCDAGESTACSTQDVIGFTLPGAFAEFIAVTRADFNLAHLPESISPTVGASLGCRMPTAYRALVDRATLRADEWLCIVGTGGVGLSALLIAKALNAKVIAVDISDKALEFAMSLGADHGLRADDPDLQTKIKTLTGGGADVAIDALGKQSTMLCALASLSTLGRYVQVGMPAGKSTVLPMPMDQIYAKQLSLHGTRGMPAHRYPSLLSLIESSQMRPERLVTKTIGLDKINDALQAFDQNLGFGVSVVVF